MSSIASVLVCTVEFVNSFVRRQHMFDVAAIPVDVDSNFISYPAPYPWYNFAQNVLSSSGGGSD